VSDAIPKPAPAGQHRRGFGQPYTQQGSVLAAEEQLDDLAERVTLEEGGADSVEEMHAPGPIC